MQSMYGQETPLCLCMGGCFQVRFSLRFICSQQNAGSLPPVLKSLRLSFPAACWERAVISCNSMPCTCILCIFIWYCILKICILKQCPVTYCPWDFQIHCMRSSLFLALKYLSKLSGTVQLCAELGKMFVSWLNHPTRTPNQCTDVCSNAFFWEQIVVSICVYVVK